MRSRVILILFISIFWCTGCRQSNVQEVAVPVLETRITIIILCVLLLIMTLAFYLVRNLAVTRGKQIEAAKKIILAEENVKSELGRKVHSLKYLPDCISQFESYGIPDAEKETFVVSVLDQLKEELRLLANLVKWNYGGENIRFSLIIEAICLEAIRSNQLNLSYAQPDQYPELPKDVQMHLFRIVRELLNNAAKYAKTARIDLDISLVYDGLLLKYADNGPGFDREKGSNTGIGIINIYARTLLMNGEVVLDTRPGFGVSWEISVPVYTRRSLLNKILRI